MLENIRERLKNIPIVRKAFLAIRMELEILKYKVGKKPVLIFNLGKVGSTSVRRSLAKSGRYAMFSAHKLTEEGLKRTKEFEGVVKVPTNYEIALYQAKRINETFFSGRRNKKNRLKIVSLTRKPLSRAISAIFENILMVRPELKSELERNNVDVDSIVKEYRDKCVLPEDGKTWFDYPADWQAGPLAFDWVRHELIEVTGINIYEQPFDKEAGYKIYRGEYVDLLLIRLENLAAVADKAFQEFFGNSDIQLRNSNVGETKVYASLYNEFKKKIHFDENYISAMHNTDFAKYFYSDEDLMKERELYCP